MKYLKPLFETPAQKNLNKFLGATYTFGAAYIASLTSSAHGNLEKIVTYYATSVFIVGAITSIAFDLYDTYMHDKINKRKQDFNNK